MIDHTFEAMGCSCRVIVEGPHEADAAQRAYDTIAAIDARLSRFRPDSELSQLNADPRPAVAASPLLCAAVGAALDAARASGGLVDPTLLGQLERTGYAGHWDGKRRLPLQGALAAAPSRRAARPSATGAWRGVRVESRRQQVVRPHGVRLDLGGTAKGFAADLAVAASAAAWRVLVDVGGDVAVGGRMLQRGPFRIAVADPFGQRLDRQVVLAAGGIATSGIDSRLWRRPDGTVAHHVLDPSTGTPAWTGVVSATAVGRSCSEAERLAKMALLGGPERARRVLGRLGGVLVLDDGRAEWLGPLAAHELTAA